MEISYQSEESGLTVTDQFYTARGVQSVAMQKNWIDYFGIEPENLKSLMLLDNLTFQDYG